MENFKGTKGKWRTHVIDGRNSTYFSIESANARVCNISSKRIELFKEEQANAQLIAHAPEMLEMLSRVNDRLIRRTLPTESEVNQFAKDIQDLLTRATTI